MDRKKIAAITLVLVGVGIGYTYLTSSGTDATSQTQVFEIEIEDQTMVAGEEMPQVRKGDTVVFHITADAAEEFHLHGYDRSVDIGPDETATLTLLADTAGRFPAELELAKIELLVLEVLP